MPTANFSHPKNNIELLKLADHMKVADFGAGSGVLALHIAEALHNTGTVYAIDVQHDLLKRIKNESHRKGLSTIDVIWGDVEKSHGSKLADHLIDRVLISNMLFQAHDKSAVLKEARRILKKDGVLVVIDWTDSFNHMGPHPEHVVDEAAARSLAEAAGFRVVESRALGGHHYGMMCMRAQ